MNGPATGIEVEARALEKTVDFVVLPEERGMAGLSGSLHMELRQDASPGIMKVPEDRVIHSMLHLWSRGMRSVGALLGATLEEERLRGNTGGVSLLGELELYDPDSIFGRPELCVISKWGLNWSALPDRLTVGYQDRYESISREYISGLVSGGFEVDIVPIKGCLGDRPDLNDLDLAIGILCRGAVLEKNGMWPIDRIWDQGPVLITIDGIRSPISRWPS
ncbi:MAG: hypothetical protein ACMUHB_04910 [Thermoplasmatota archaeon]